MSDNIADRLPEGFISLGYVAVVKCLNAEGEVSLATVDSGGLAPWESLGMLMTAVEDFKAEIRACTARDDD